MMISIPYDDSGEATRLVRSMMFVVVIFLGGFLAWSYLAPISGAVVADGSVKVNSKRKTVQHLEGGLVEKILVHEGDYVKAGQVLLVLQDAEVRSNLTILNDQLNSELAREARLLAEKKLDENLVFPKKLMTHADAKLREMLANEQAVFATRRKALNDEIGVINNEISHARQEETSVVAEIAAARESLRLKSERVTAGEALSARQYLEKNQLLMLREEYADTQRALNRLEAEQSELKQRQSELELRIINLRNEYAKSADTELKETRKTIYEIQEKVRPARLSLERFEITAPTSGQVIDLKVSTVGGVVRPGEPLMDIVPKQLDLVVEVQVKPRDIAKVHVGQRADLLLLAYYLRDVPHIDGEVTYVSEDALEPQGPKDSPYYAAYVRVDRQSLEKVPEVRLTPGMPVTAYIQTKPTTFVNMMLRPFSETLSRGLRPQP